MQATLGVDVVATLVAPGVLPAYPVGARIETPITRAIQSYWRPAAYDPVTGVWTVVIAPPVTVGGYLLVWRDSGPEPPELEVFVPLAVARAGLTMTAPGEDPAWMPSSDEVAAQTPNYTVGGFDDDRENAGSMQGEYTEDTSPTRSEVEAMVTAACEEIIGWVGVAIPADQYGLAKQAAIAYVKAMIASDKSPGSVDEASSQYRGAIARYLSSRDQLTVNSRRPSGGRLH